MKHLILTLTLFVVGCAHKPNCGILPEAKVVLYANSCKQRIKHVVLGNDLKIPESLKKDLSLFDVGWKEPELKNGKIETGSFIILTDEEKKP